MGGGPGKSFLRSACVVMVAGLTAAGAGLDSPGDSVNLCASRSANMESASGRTSASVIPDLLEKPATKMSTSTQLLLTKAVNSLFSNPWIIKPQVYLQGI